MILPETNSHITSTGNIEQVMLAIEVEMTYTSSNSESFPSNWFFKVTRVPDCILSLSLPVETWSNKGRIIDPTILLSFGSSVANSLAGDLILVTDIENEELAGLWINGHLGTIRTPAKASGHAWHLVENKWRRLVLNIPKTNTVVDRSRRHHIVCDIMPLNGCHLLSMTSHLGCRVWHVSFHPVFIGEHPELDGCILRTCCE